jgi:RND family efflux transporter MFP subunit
MKIVQTDPIRLQANVAEADLSRIKLGSRVSVAGRDPGAAPFTARVTSVSPTVDPSTRTGIVEAVVPNRDTRFMPGQYLRLEISTGIVEDALHVPLAAVRSQAEAGSGLLASGASHYVWVAEKSVEPGAYTVSPADVTTGVTDGEHIQILAGLEPGQMVVTSGANYLKRGDRVAVSGARGAAR